MNSQLTYNEAVREIVGNAHIDAREVMLLQQMQHVKAARTKGWWFYWLTNAANLSALVTLRTEACSVGFGPKRICRQWQSPV